MARFFIDRPVLSSVISLLIVLAGILSLGILPVSQYPDIVPPEIVVSATYSGASAEVVASTVASPLEDQINGVGGMIYMKSSCNNNGSLKLTVTFEVGTDPDQAAIDVNNRVQIASRRLPEEVRKQGVTVSKRSSSILQVITLSSHNNNHDATYLSNYALLHVIEELKRLPGVGDASLFGAKNYSMRIWLKPDQLAQYSLTTDDIANAIREQNSPYAGGSFGQEPTLHALAYTYTTTTPGQRVTVEDFEEIILRSNENASVLKLKDVARVELGAQDYAFEAVQDDKPAVPIGIYLQPGANGLAVTALIQQKMQELTSHFPEGIFYYIPFDTTLFVRASIQEVLVTLGEALLLVIAIVYLFLQSGRATLIPLVAVPISLIGTFAGMYVLGFSINLLTLFGLVLAIGIVVDDAIVVLENIERLMAEEKLSPYEAAVSSMRQVASPVIAIVLVLCAVFVPVSFMGGLAGEMYRQFAITIAISVTISGFVALTLTPALCARLLKNQHLPPTKFFNAFNQFFEKSKSLYVDGVQKVIKYAKTSIAVFLVIISICAFLYMRVPTSLVPEEDQGFVFVVSALLPGTSLKKTQATTREVSQSLEIEPNSEQVLTLTGFDLLSGGAKTNAGVSFVKLKDWKQRKGFQQSAQALAGKTMGLNATMKDAWIIALCPPPIMGMGMTGGFEFYLGNRSGASIENIAEVAEQYMQAARQRPEITSLRSMISIATPQFEIELDRIKAKALDVPIASIFSTMQSTFGNYYVNDFTLFGKSYQINIQSDHQFREGPEDLRYVFVRSEKGAMIPLSSLIKLKHTVGPDLIERFNGFPAVKIMGNAAPGYSSGEAMIAAESVARQLLANDYTIGWVGSSYQEKVTEGSGNQAFIFGLIVVFLILAALYERWSLPIAVLTAVPFAVLGALLAVWIRGLNNDVYFQVSLVTLIGLAAKNAILIVEFALIKRKEGLSIEDAVLKACQLRFRPIIMTSMAFIFGCLPLAISTGAGAASRHSLGTGIVGGMLGATCLAIFFVPLFFKLIVQFEEGRTASIAKGKEIRHET
ncbi:MAG: hydrophobe/amphiphile efflux family protein [Chlamydiales bacterium]|jgi:multidrug efflux pump|nr:hydrophobe/amphiphile efflux family protein [Chlamydiales bacterium]